MVEPSEPGEVKCMKCQRLFPSADRKRIRRCQRCKESPDSYMPRRSRDFSPTGTEKYFD
jgi:hypothetical protein